MKVLTDLLAVVLVCGGLIFVTVVIVQLSIIRMALRDAPEPYWSQICDGLKELHEAMGYRWFSKYMLWLGMRLWPPVREK
jgi:hypothetical protein